MGWTDVDYLRIIVMFLSAVWTAKYLQVPMEIKKLIYILDALSKLT